MDTEKQLVEYIPPEKTSCKNKKEKTSSYFTNIFKWSSHKDIVFWGVLGGFILILLVTMFHIFFGGANENQPTPGAGWFFLKLSFLALIAGAIYSREKIHIAGFLVGLAGLIFLVLLGKFNSFFSWAVIGLPFFSAIGIWGVTKTEGRIRSFLGFASGIIILYWLFLFYQGHPIINFGFIGKQFFADDTAKSIFVIFLVVLLFAVWKRSKIFYLISFIVLLSFIGNNMTNEIVNRFPQRLTPNISQKYKKVWEETEDALLEKIHKATTNNTSNTTSTTSQPKLVATVVRSTSKVFATSVKTLLPGKYYQIPAGETTYQFLGEKFPRPVGDGKNFVIPPGKKVVGIKTNHQKVQIYQVE